MSTTTSTGTTAPTRAGRFQRPKVNLSRQERVLHDHTGHEAAGPHGHTRGRGHGLMMIACCIPMLVIAVVLVAAGVVSAGFIIVALACTAMMAVMHLGMGHGGHGGGGHGGQGVDAPER